MAAAAARAAKGAMWAVCVVEERVVRKATTVGRMADERVVRRAAAADQYKFQYSDPMPRRFRN